MKVYYYIKFNKDMKQQENSTTRTQKPTYRHTFIPITPNNNEKTLKYNQSLQQVRNIAVNNQKLQQELAIYDWRSKTQFPIVKILHCKLMQRKTNTTVLEVKKQKYCLKLKNCKQLPLFKVLYLLKESLIGFQRLYDKFGPFLVTPGMITIDNCHKCRVWVNQNYASNTFIPLKSNLPTFLSEIYRIFEAKSNKLKNTGHFYQQLYTCKTFFVALNFIQNFSKENKIVISTYCRLTPRQIIEQSKEEEFDFTASLSINKKSEFLPLSGLRISLNSTSENPFKKNRNFKAREQQKSEKDYYSYVVKQKNKKTEDTTQEASYKHSRSNDPEKKNRDKEIDIQQNKETIYKSQVPINVSTPQKGKFCVRKCNSNSLELKQFTKQTPKTEQNVNNIDLNPKQQTVIASKNYGNINDNEDQQTTKNKIEDTFIKNQWNKTINGLLQEDSDLKQSIVNTQEKIKAKMTPIKLELLGKITKNVYESFINTEHIVFHQSEPQTTEY